SPRPRAGRRRPSSPPTAARRRRSRTHRRACPDPASWPPPHCRHLRAACAGVPSLSSAAPAHPQPRARHSPAKAGLLRVAAVDARSVADLLLQVLPALLLVDRALGGEASFQPLQADLLARIDAEAVLARIHALERAVDLADQLAVAVAGA